MPKLEPLHPSANRMYAMHGRTYWPITDDRPFDERGAAAIIEPRRAGAATASGEPYDPASLSAGHPRLPIPSYARVTHRASGRSVLVRINDRGPVRRDRVIALSEAAAQRIGAADGDAVEIVRLTNAEILQMEAARRTAAPVAAAAPAAVAIPAPAAVAPAAAPVEVLAPPVPTPPGVGAAPRAAPTAPQPAAPAATMAAVAPPPVPMPPVPAPGAAASTVGAPPAAAAPRPAEGAAPPVAAPRPAPSPVRPATAAPAAGAGAPMTAAAAPAAGAVAAAPPPAPRPAPAGRAPRWAVQIGAFAVQDNADTLSERAARQLASALADVPASDRTPRVERRGNRFVVLVGDFGDLARAEAHGLKVGGALRQNVTVVPR